MAQIEVKVKDRTPELMQKLEKAIGAFVVKGAGHIHGRLKASMAEPKSGRMYGDHQASAPGESPAVDSGNLTGSIVQVFPSTLEALIGTPVEYAVYLETGTSRMAQRPLWEKTAADELPTLEKMLDKEIEGIATRV